MRNSDHMALIPMPKEVNDSNWQRPCNEKLQQLLTKRFDSSVNHLQIGIIEDTMSYELHNAVYDEKEDVNNFLDVLESVCTHKQHDCSTILHQTTATGDTLLHVAAEYGRVKIVELLVDNNFLLHVKNMRKDTPLHVAARARNLGVMKVILSKFKDASSKDDFIMSENIVGNKALHEAILSMYWEGFDFLLKEQNERSLPRYWDTYPAKSPMYVAVQTGDVKILHRLLEIPFPSDQAIYNCRGNSPLHAAILECKPALLGKILEEKEELMWFRDEHGDTPLHYAACIGYEKGVRTLLKKSTLLAFQRNSNGNVPIHLACERGHVRVVKQLIGIEWPHTRFWLNNKSQNILHVAAKSGQNKLVKHLLKHPKIQPETVNERDLHGDTPLHLASRKLHLWTLFHLSRYKKINVNLVNDQGLTARDVARMQYKIPMTRQEFRAEMILRTAAIPVKGTMLGVQHEANKEWNVKEKASTLIIVATLIATVTFAAAFTVPGGVYSSDDHEKRGMAVLAGQTLFRIFMVFNTIAMYSSIFGTIILLRIYVGDPRNEFRAYFITQLFIQLAIITMPVAFMAAIRLVVSNNTSLAGLTSVIAFIFISLVIFIFVLGCFPLGILLPPFRQVGELILWINVCLFYGLMFVYFMDGGIIVFSLKLVKSIKTNKMVKLTHLTQGNQVNRVSRVNHCRTQLKAFSIRYDSGVVPSNFEEDPANEDKMLKR